MHEPEETGKDEGEDGLIEAGHDLNQLIYANFPFRIRKALTIKGKQYLSATYNFITYHTKITSA